MNKKLIATSVISATMLTLAGCGSTPSAPKSAEEKAMELEMRKAFLAKIQGMNVNSLVPNAQQQNVQATSQPEPTITEQELLAKKVEVDKTGGAALFSRQKDGILINENMYNDYEGSVVNIGANRLTGEFTYAIQNFDGSFTLKYNKANSQHGAIKVATVYKQGDSFKVNTVTGKTFTGSSVTPTSDGFVIGRKGSAFRYVIGSEQVKSITLLDGYHIAKHQNGDVASTNFILLEKDEAKKSDSLGNFLSATKDLGNAFGINKVDDYVLININNGKQVPLDVSASGKNVAKHSGCVNKGLYNKCSNVSFNEALYEKSGLKNNSHYFWSIDWIDTKTGPLAFYKTSSKVKVVDINKEQVHTVFSRALGVNEFTLIEKVDGTVGVKAQLGFSSDLIEDVEQFIRSNTQDIEPMQNLGE
ncbi:hypothetical protein AAEU28_12510 [Pseudoalteromonas sp. SS15]|uniref:hypothetical protein n=1 Tax=Pseudoalteromonas sp. SS15 TaxID=3139393 RepID=UPI003BAC38D1